MVGHVFDTRVGKREDELVSQLNVRQRISARKNKGLGFLLWFQAVMDLNYRVVNEFIYNDLTVSCLDSEGNGRVRKARHDKRACEGVKRLQEMGIIAYHCIYDEVYDTHYYLGFDITAKTDVEFFCSISLRRPAGTPCNYMAVYWFDSFGDYHCDTMDVDVHDGVIYVVDNHPDLRSIDNITCDERERRDWAYEDVCYPLDEVEENDYGEPFSTGEPEFDRVYEIGKDLIDLI